MEGWLAVVVIAIVMGIARVQVRTDAARSRWVGWLVPEGDATPYRRAAPQPNDAGVPPVVRAAAVAAAVWSVLTMMTIALPAAVLLLDEAHWTGLTAPMLATALVPLVLAGALAWAMVSTTAAMVDRAARSARRGARLAALVAVLHVAPLVAYEVHRRSTPELTSWGEMGTLFLAAVATGGLVVAVLVALAARQTARRDAISSPDAP